MEKIATKLTPRIKEFIREDFNSDYYDNDSEENLFHFPNTRTLVGFDIGNHTFEKIQEDYKEVTEQEFLDYFKKEEPDSLEELTNHIKEQIKVGAIGFNLYKGGDIDIKFEKPIHYSQTKSGMDVFDVARDWNIEAPELFSALKYILRCGKKDEPIKEIDKAIDCLNRYKEVLK